MAKQECLTYFFGMCVHSEEQAREIILGSGIGGMIALGLVALAIAISFFSPWRTRNTALDTMDDVLSGRPTKSKRYIEIRSPFW